MCAAMQKLLWLGVGVGLGGWPLDDTFCTIQKCQFWSENNFSLNICLGANYIRNQYWPMQKNTALISDPKNMSKIWIYVERASRYKLINLSRYKGFCFSFFLFCPIFRDVHCMHAGNGASMRFLCPALPFKFFMPCVLHQIPHLSHSPPPLAPWDF